MKCSSACWWISAIRNGCSPSARPASCGSSIARPASFSTHKETVFQNVFDQIDPKTGAPTYRSDILEQETGKWVQSCPSTEGGHNWQAMSYHPPTGAADHSAQPELHGDVRPQGGVQRWLGRNGGRSALLRDAGHQRQRRQAGGVRREDHEGKLVVPAARAVSDRRAFDRRGRRVCRRSRPHLPSRRCEDRHRRCGRRGWEHRCRAFRCRSASAASSTSPLPTGLGGGSPRQVPATIAPDIHHPGNGNALYVFALPEK